MPTPHSLLLFRFFPSSSTSLQIAFQNQLHQTHGSNLLTCQQNFLIFLWFLCVCYWFWLCNNWFVDEAGFGAVWISTVIGVFWFGWMCLDLENMLVCEYLQVLCELFGWDLRLLLLFETVSEDWSRYSVLCFAIKVCVNCCVRVVFWGSVYGCVAGLAFWGAGIRCLDSWKVLSLDWCWVRNYVVRLVLDMADFGVWVDSCCDSVGFWIWGRWFVGLWVVLFGCVVFSSLVMRVTLFAGFCDEKKCL